MEKNISPYEEKTSPLFFWGIFFILFLPIILVPPTFQPSDWTRVILLRTTLVILICFFLFRFFYKKDISIPVPKWKNPVYWPFLTLLGLFIVLIISTIFSQDIRFSIFGSPVRAGGILNLLFYIIFTVFLVLFVTGQTWNKIFKTNFIVGAIASVMAVVQYFGLLKNIFLGWEAGGPPSFLGNSTFLAIYMLFLLFSSFALFINEGGKKKKILYGVLSFLFLITILITGSRATYLGVLIGFMFYFFFYPKKLKIFKIIAVFFLALSVFIVLIFNFFPQIFKSNLGEMIANRLSIRVIVEDLAGTRLSAWKITFDAIKEKPLLGWGPENFYIGFEKYFDPTLPPSLQKLWWDRPHNAFLEIWASSGIFALFLYITFWIILLWRLQMFKRKQGNNEYTYLAHGLQAMFIGYLVVLFFNFDSFSTYLISFLFIGYSFYLLSLQGEKIIIQPSQKTFFQKKPVALFLLAIALIFVWFWNIKPLYLNEKLVFAQNLSKAKQCKKALEIINNESWERAGILRAYAVLKYSDIIRNCAFAQPDKEIEYSQKALSLLKIASSVQPKFSRTWLFMGAFTNVLAAREKNIENKNKLLLEAMGYLEKSLELSPKRQEIFIEMEKNYLIAEDYKEMKRIGEDCIKIDPSLGECYWYLGIAEIFSGDQENGKKHIEESYEKNYRNPPYKQLAIAYISQNNWQDAVKAYERIDIPKEKTAAASHHATLAYLYRQSGNYTRATQEAVKVFELQPDNPETIKFLEVLLGLSPKDPLIHSSLAYVYRQSGKEEKARQELLILKSIYLQLIAKDYNNTDHHFQLAGIYKELEDYENAYKEALRIIKIKPEIKETVEEFITTLPGDYWPNYVKDTRYGK